MKFTVEKETTTGQSITDFIAAKNYRHNVAYDQANVRIRSIPESEEVDNILTDKGYLILKADTEYFHVYSIFDVSSNETFDNVDIDYSGVRNKSTHYETIHTLVMYKDGNNKYYSNFTLIGNYKENNTTKQLCRLDIDAVKYNNVVYTHNNDGFYHLSGQISATTKVRMLGVSHKEYLYFNIIHPTDNINSISISFVDNNDYTVQLIEDHLYKIDISNAIGVQPLDTASQYLFFTVSGTASTPDTILVEVY